MNTQTHILLAAALFARPGRPLRNTAAISGGFIPDASLFVMWAYGRLTGVSENVIWNDMYWRPEWQETAAITNSVPLCVGLALASALADTPARDRLPGSLLSYSRSSAVADAILVLALSAIVHIATDFPLHVLDGHPAFWPFSEWIFQSGISYWDPHYYGNVISLAELALAGGLIVLLWLRFRSWMVRCVLLSAAFSYGAMAYHWATAF